MRGLQHNVIEIKDTENDEIERILVFLKPGTHTINVSNTGQEAKDILQKVKVRRSLPKIRINPSVATALAVGALVLAALIVAVV